MKKITTTSHGLLLCDKCGKTITLCLGEGTLQQGKNYIGKCGCGEIKTIKYSVPGGCFFEISGVASVSPMLDEWTNTISAR